MNRDSVCAAAGRVYAVLLRAYPKEFRERFGREMRQTFRDRCRAALAERRSGPLICLLLLIAGDWLASAARERITQMTTVTRGRRPWRDARRLGLAAMMLLVCLLAGTPFLQAFVVPTASMEGSLRVGDHILVDKLARGRDLRRGDLVAFHYPDDPRATLLKRVIGLPGDRIRLADKQVLRNGRRLVEPYARHVMPSTDRYRDNFPAGSPPVAASPRAAEMLANHVAGGEVIVPAGSLSVLGDNRDLSIDSRYWGFIPMDEVVGKPVLIYWSYDAPTADLEHWSWRHTGDVAAHLLTRTRWDRTLRVPARQSPAEVAP